MSSVPPSILAHCGHHLPRYQTAAEDVVFGYLLADPAQKKHLGPAIVARAGRQVRYRLEAQTQADASDAGTRAAAVPGGAYRDG